MIIARTHTGRLLLILSLTSNFVACSAENKSDDKDAEAEVTNDEPADPADPGTTGDLAITGMNAFPYATEPVVASASLAPELKTKSDDFDSPTAGTLALPSMNLQASGSIALGESTSSSTFADTDEASFGACEMVNRSRGFLHEAATGDAVQCEIGLMGTLPALAELYDGQPHIIKEEDGDETSLMKIQIEGTKDAIIGFTLHQCTGGEQSLYVKSRIDPDTKKYTFIAKRIGEPDNPQVNKNYADIRVSGHVDDKGSFVGLKTMDNTTSNEFASGGVSFNRYQIVQSAKHILFQGVQQQTDKSTPDRFVSFFELIDGNSADEPFALGKLGIGDGGIVIALDDGDGILQGWRGASRKIDGDVPHVAKIREHQTNLPVAEEPQAIAFAGDEAWDCSDEGAITITEEDFTTAGLTEDDFAVCDGFYLPQNDHLECRQIASDTPTE